jgi:hypothetical protein
MPIGWVALAGAAISAVGSIEQGQAQSNAANYQSQVAANNAKIAQQNAAYSLAAGQVQATDQGLKNRAQGGRIVASQAANNVDVNSGSAVAVQQSQRETGMENVQQTLQNANLQAYGYRTGAISDTAQSQLYGLEANQAPIGADLGAAGGLLSHASSFNLTSAFGSAFSDGTGDTGW